MKMPFFLLAGGVRKSAYHQGTKGTKQENSVVVPLVPWWFILEGSGRDRWKSAGKLCSIAPTVAVPGEGAFCRARRPVSPGGRRRYDGC
jgi:hypothetical protein